jgi:hypothetical protein
MQKSMALNAHGAPLRNSPTRGYSTYLRQVSDDCRSNNSYRLSQLKFVQAGFSWLNKHFRARNGLVQFTTTVGRRPGRAEQTTAAQVSGLTLGCAHA